MAECARSRRAPGKRWFAAVLGCVVLISGAAQGALGDARKGQCKRPELAWDTWRAHVQKQNPGLRSITLEGDQRRALLAAMKCLEESAKCPPDKAVVFHCVGNQDVLVALVKDGCVTIAEEMAVERFIAIVGKGETC